ncbi:lipopolysaccharide biosynthesis protein [Lutimonas halocynthiae]|uniref:lipopolysaccharide biosynthesis protein n=1 Tax=Lutimonas halocynthiae TaxID=1446477 RepID=UPI0025B29A84|nr:lipopolysaccharide biosynthesis protein [Lutimonas halocynthiae]MDN3643784.1 lipopolysaccharide biosynthesis protein [Lutimonas halocynthiae]
MWNLVEKLSIKFVRFFLGIIMARILLPEDFGLIGMLSVFVAIAQVLTESGMGAGLIQKNDRSDDDFSTVLIFNFIVSVLCYIMIFIFAPFIASFFEKPELVLITRVLTLNIVINSMVIVQRTKMIIEFDFKTIAKINFIAIFISGISGVLFAYFGYGVWALVIQNLLFSIFTTFLFWVLSRWRFSLVFSTNSFNNLFSYGYKLLFSGVLVHTLNNLYNIIIGKYYSASELGYYTRAKGFVDLAEGTFSGIIQSVSFPLLSSLQQDKIQLILVFKKMIRMSAFVIFPAMCLLAILAEPIVILLLTKKWIFVVPLLQYLAIARIFYSLSLINMSILKSIGRSDLFLKVDFLKIPIIGLVLLICLNYGIIFLVIGQIVISAFDYIINTYYPGKILGYGFLNQLKDLLPIVLLTSVTSSVVYFLSISIEHNLLNIFFSSVIMVTIYLGLSYFFKFKELEEIIRLLKIQKNI